VVGKILLEPAKRGGSIKPGVERSGNPRIIEVKRNEPTKWAIAVKSK
jgi:hypothetical protein